MLRSYYDDIESISITQDDWEVALESLEALDKKDQKSHNEREEETLLKTLVIPWYDIPDGWTRIEDAVRIEYDSF